MKYTKLIFSVLVLMLLSFIVNEQAVSQGYLKNTTNSKIIDTITTAGDSADASYIFRNDGDYKFLVIEYIQAAAPIKTLKLNIDYPTAVKVTYDEADSTIKVWTLRELGYVLTSFYATVDYSSTSTTTSVVSGNDTTTGTTTAALVDANTVNGATVVDSVRTITGTHTYALINDKYSTITTTTTNTITDPTKPMTELVVTPDSGTKTFIFMIRGTDEPFGYSQGKSSKYDNERKFINPTW